MNVSRALRATAFALAALFSGSALAAGGPALVVELESGRVLHAERATDPWFPASITKLMTAYVALDKVRSGQMSMETLLTVTDGAAALPPSKMGFKPGTQIRLDNALKIMMVKSANDIAATIAENIGGSIDGFADLMNAHAQRLGMVSSHFVNPHGLPDERNQTTARDMAVLARALLLEFPEDRELFDIGAVQYGRRIMRNTNGLIGRYPGADGMKTGFICSAGFNVVASATRNGRHLITVVLGAQSANERTIKAAELFDRGFSSKVNFTNPELAALPVSSNTTPPDMRPVICDRRGPMPQEEDAPVVAETDSNIPNLFSSEVMAFAGNTTEKPVRTALGPRAAVQPERVWIGLNPPSEAELAAQAAAEEAAEQARKAKTKKATASKKAPAKKTDAKAADESETADKEPVKSTAKGKDQGRASVAVKPVTGNAKPASKPAAKAPQKADANGKPKSVAN
ncbi:D-alanyl-D-alanine carboxypeptidase family protein [Microvirga mediterraneensis]|uniref:D-alanyl-D-alanine carboxypeptidase n=1 Tax=Microvirga mediterraneensis TaxID=2754695 RepID=A0A838BIE8_9HYPH|nr:D-alanyl-D-alanine carboxypeptidase family protein [Microvirga mediterraneensis]MBA1154965.1 D-alanyl-D-alanine carboxypeptidase [Microvirga mediterraneensis]